MVEQSEFLDKMLQARAHTIERDEDFSGRLHHAPTLTEHVTDRIFIAAKINHAGCVDDSLVCSIAERQGRCVRLNEVKPTSALGVPDHLGTEIHAVAMNALRLKLGHEQALPGADHEDG